MTSKHALQVFFLANFDPCPGNKGCVETRGFCKEGVCGSEGFIEIRGFVRVREP